MPHGFQASIVLGKTLVLGRTEAAALVAEDPRVSRWVRDYLSGDDLVSTVGPRSTRLRRRFAEGVEVHHHEIDRRDAVFGDLRSMFRAETIGQDATVDLRMESLHPAVQDLGKARHVGNRRCGHPRRPKRLERSSGREDLEPGVDQAADERFEVSLVEYGDEGTARGRHGGG
jgi:hypothetical protein